MSAVRRSACFIKASVFGKTPTPAIMCSEWAIPTSTGIGHNTEAHYQAARLNDDPSGQQSHSRQYCIQILKIESYSTRNLIALFYLQYDLSALHVKTLITN